MIVCGDFNDVPNSYAYARIGQGLKDAFREKGNGCSRTFSQISPTLRIDYILFDPAYNAYQYDCIQRVLSDHFPIMATLYDPAAAISAPGPSSAGAPGPASPPVPAAAPVPSPPPAK